MGPRQPPYKGHIGTRHFVLYIEVVFSLEVQNLLSRYEVLHLGPLNLSFSVLYTDCPLYKVPHCITISGTMTPLKSNDECPAVSVTEVVLYTMLHSKLQSESVLSESCL